MNDVAQGPIAVPQALPAAQPASGFNVAPPSNGTPHDPTVDGFAKIAAERRARFGQPPKAVPFGTLTIRIHSSMPAAFAVDLASAQNDPAAAVTALRSAIIDDDIPLFERILRLPPDNAESIDGDFLLAFITELGGFYSGVPLAVS